MSPEPDPKTDTERTDFAHALQKLGAVQFGSFTLKDGGTSPVYCDLRLLISDPSALKLAAEFYAEVLAPLRYDRLAAIPYAGLPIGAAVALEVERPMIFPRKEVKAYGAKRAIEGTWHAGETAVVLDDLVSRGTSKLEAAEPLKAAGLKVQDIVVLIDRRPAGETSLEEAGFTLHSAFTLAEIAQRLSDSGLMDEKGQEAIRSYLEGS